MLPFINPMLAGGGGLNVDQVFHTKLYNAPSASSIDVPIAPDLVWNKSRSDTQVNFLLDSLRLDRYLSSQIAGRDTSIFAGASPNGIRKTILSTQNNINSVAWCFRRKLQFFDVVKYTGNSVAGRQVAHNLGVKPGMIIVKRFDTDGNWYVQHMSLTSRFYLLLETADPTTNRSNIWNNTEPTSTSFTLGSGATNISGGQYIAYIFAHDAGPTGVIQCGQYTGNGNNIGPVINLGWEPQWLLVKRTDNGASTDWLVLDNKRSTSNPRFSGLYPNTSSAENNSGNTLFIDFLPNGFQLRSSGAIINTNGGTYVYMAIRKGKL